jgi:hypothetical protein
VILYQIFVFPCSRLFGSLIFDDYWEDIFPVTDLWPLLERFWKDTLSPEQTELDGVDPV